MELSGNPLCRNSFWTFDDEQCKRDEMVKIFNVI